MSNSIARQIAAGFFRLNIRKKMFLGYLPLAVLMMLISVLALSSLSRLNKINSGIIKTDAPLEEAADKLIDSLFAQELYGRRYGILKSRDILSLFNARSEDFERLLEQIRSLPDTADIPVDRLFVLHQEYTGLFIAGFKYLSNPSSRLAKKYNSQIKDKQEELIDLIKNIAAKARSKQSSKMRETAGIGHTAFWLTAMLCSLGVIFGISVAVLITRNIAGAVRTLKLATQEVSEGKFEWNHHISNKDELGELAGAFREMTQRLKILEEIRLDTNSLTRLPGGRAIEGVLKKRLSEAAPLAFCMIDMDNFKAFNDRYGYARGSELIQATARILEDTVAEHGSHEDFIGHIGGDDFVVITTPGRYAGICNGIIEAFDKTIPGFYNSEDRSRGYITGKNRQGQEMNFPIMTISIAVVTNQQRELTSPIQIGEIAAELKEFAKSIPRSVYVTDKRGGSLQQPESNGIGGALPKGNMSDKEAVGA